MAWLGFIYLLIIAGVVFGIPAYIGYKRRSVVAYKKRRRQVETALHRAEFDREVIEDVVHEWVYGPPRHPRRR